MVSSSALIEAQPPSADAKTATTMQAAAASRLGRMVRKNYNADWDAGFGAPMEAMVPAAMGGRRLDQALARLFPQYSRTLLQAWLVSGHIRVDGAQGHSRKPVTGGGRVTLQPPPPPRDGPQAQRMPLQVGFRDAGLIGICKPAGLGGRPGARVPHRPP